MWLIEQLWKALLGDPSPLRPTAAEFDNGETGRAFMEAVRERRQFQVERDCFKRLLLQGGETERTLAARVKLYERELRSEVRKRA